MALKPLLEAITDLSSLTRIQVETLQLDIEVHKSTVNIRNALKIRKNSGISRGTYYRILAQGRKNIRESLFTLVIAVQMGLLKQDDIQRLISSISMIPEDIDRENLTDVLALVGALADHVVMS